MSDYSTWIGLARDQLLKDNPETDSPPANTDITLLPKCDEDKLPDNRWGGALPMPSESVPCAFSWSCKSLPLECRGLPALAPRHGTSRQLTCWTCACHRHFVQVLRVLRPRQRQALYVPGQHCQLEGGMLHDLQRKHAWHAPTHGAGVLGLFPRPPSLHLGSISTHRRAPPRVCRLARASRSGRTLCPFALI